MKWFGLYITKSSFSVNRNNGKCIYCICICNSRDWHFTLHLTMWMSYIFGQQIRYGSVRFYFMFNHWSYTVTVITDVQIFKGDKHTSHVLMESEVIQPYGICGISVCKVPTITTQGNFFMPSNTSQITITI